MAFEKELKFGNEARAPILEGARKVASAVIATLGPLGRNVAIRRGEMKPPLITKDGVTVAREIKSLPDFYEDMGLQMVKEAAAKTNQLAGDGTTTATLLAYELMKEGLTHIKQGSNAIQIRRGMEQARDVVLAKLQEMAIPIEKPEEFTQIATVSSQDSEIGALVSLVYQEVGKDGAITVEAAQAIGIDYVLTEGMQLSSGYASQDFVNVRGKLQCVMKDPFILLCDERITTVQQILPTIELVNKAGGSLVIIAESVEFEALTALVVNLPHIKVQGQDPGQKANFESLAIRAPEIGQRRLDVLEDIAKKVGARVISKKIGLSLNSVTLSDLGKAEMVVAGFNTTTIINGEGSDEDVSERASQIKEQIDQTEDDHEKDFLRGRLGNLIGHIGQIRVGAATEVEQKEKQHRVEDAVAAVRAASEEGIVPGGGTAYIRCIRDADDGTTDEKIGFKIVMDTLSKPLWWIAHNAGYESDEVVAKVTAMAHEHDGFNAETGKYVDLVKHNIIDPKKVSRCALENAVSIAGSFLTIEVGVVDVVKPDSKMQQ